MGRVVERELSGAPFIKFDLIALLHSMGMTRSEIVAYTPIVKRPDVKTRIGERIIDNILKRTLSGEDKDGKLFKSYSESYKNSTMFKIYKGGDETVNLKLIGDMHADLEVVELSGGQVSIGFTEATESDKAKGHITGANYLPRRDFFGLPKRELENIVFEEIAFYEGERILDIDITDIEETTSTIENLTLDDVLEFS